MVHRVRGRGGSSEQEEECDVGRRLRLRAGRRRQLRGTSLPAGQRFGALGAGRQGFWLLCMVLSAGRGKGHAERAACLD